MKPGTLYIVATPIGNMDDMGARAIRVLSGADLIAAEDTRHSQQLLRHFGIETPMCSYHEFNERTVAAELLEMLRQGKDIALISDAGTPLISDPGYRLVAMAHDESLKVVPIPGPSALVSALSVCGLAAERFCFEGYLPSTAARRRTRLAELASEERALVFFEAPHRIEVALDDLAAAFGPERRATIARELTKRFETVRRGSLGELLQWLRADADQRKGEFVVVVEGAPPAAEPEEKEARRVLQILLRHLSVRDAAAAAAELTGGSRKALYALALELKQPQA
jgi:16S rRNA (cytidine1402-2'-O)-methyltransferase